MSIMKNIIYIKVIFILKVVLIAFSFITYKNPWKKFKDKIQHKTFRHLNTHFPNKNIENQLEELVGSTIN